MFRTADGTQLQHLYLCGITPTPIHPTVERTALGAENTSPWDYHGNALDLANKLISAGYRLWVLEDIPGAASLYDVFIDTDPRPILLIVGNEVCGVDPGLIKLAERMISIPMMGKKRSYNVAVAFGIAASYLSYCQICSQGSTRIFPST
jgi:tRNA G18 (ribose-2'-O)-methylase SpoU